jgi:hypothetical protein
MIDSPYGGRSLDLGGDKDSGSGGVKSKGGKSGPLGGMNGNEDGKEKKRKPVLKLDEARLLGLNGSPQLVKDTKNFKPKGKGHEVKLFFSFACCSESIPHPSVGDRPGSRASTVPILDAQIISKDEIQGDGRSCGEVMPLEAHAGTLYVSCIPPPRILNS